MEDTFIEGLLDSGMHIPPWLVVLQDSPFCLPPLMEGAGGDGGLFGVGKIFRMFFFVEFV